MTLRERLEAEEKTLMDQFLQAEGEQADVLLEDIAFVQFCLMSVDNHDKRKQSND